VAKRKFVLLCPLWLIINYAFGVLGFNRRVRGELRRGRGVFIEHFNTTLACKIEALCFIESAEHNG
jgi:hypothetical protein